MQKLNKNQALVFGVIAFSIFSQSMLNELRSTSTKTGFRFNKKAPPVTHDYSM